MVTTRQTAIETKDELHQRKMDALAKFVDVLLSSPEGKDIAKVILFGSVARGDEIEDSDIDVLVFTLGNESSLEKTALSLAWEITVLEHNYISPMVYPLSDFYYPLDFFIPSALHSSKEVFTMSDDQVRRITVRNNYALALDYIESAEVTYKAGRVRAAIDTAYNAAELIAKSFLAFEVDELPTRHGGVIGLFSDIYIMQKQMFPPMWGRRLNLLLANRHKARYEWAAKLTEEMATDGIALAHELAERLRQYLAETVDKNKEDSDEQKDNP